jgi:hypothetical protein
MQKHYCSLQVFSSFLPSFLPFWTPAELCTCCLSPLFPLDIFQIGSQSMPRLSWTAILLFMLPRIPGMTGACHHTQPLVEIGSEELLVWADRELWSSWSVPPRQLGLQAWATSIQLSFFSHYKCKCLFFFIEMKIYTHTYIISFLFKFE